MGACFNSMELDGKLSKEEVTVKFNTRCEQDSYENGHSYSGSFSQFSGLDFHDKLFDIKVQAEEYVNEHGQKWGPAVCVQYRHIENTKQIIVHSEAIRKLTEKFWLAERKHTNARSKMLINNRSTKPAYVTKAEENLQAVKDLVEPKIQVRKDKIEEIKLKLAAKSTDIRWYLGGWCSS